jgi:hypothetical protein
MAFPRLYMVLVYTARKQIWSPRPKLVIDFEGTYLIVVDFCCESHYFDPFFPRLQGTQHKTTQNINSVLVCVQISTCLEEQSTITFCGKIHNFSNIFK